MMRKLLVPLFVLAAVAFAVVYYKATGGSGDTTLTGVVTTDDVILSSQIQGRLAQLLVKEGDAVKPGQLVAVIEPEELRADKAFYAHSEEGAAAQVQEAEAALASAEAQQAEAAADLERARLDFERTEGLFKQQVLSVQALDQTRTTYEAQKARLESVRKQAEAQRAAVALARSNVEQIAVRRQQLQAGRHQLAAVAAQVSKAQVRLNYTEIRAPIPGVVAVLAARQGEVVNAGQAIVSLINPDDLWVRADVEETYIDRIRLGDHFTVRFPSGMERQGSVFYRGVDADYATQRDVSRTKRDIKTFEIRLRVDNGERRIWPGLTAFVVLPAEVTRRP